MINNVRNYFKEVVSFIPEDSLNQFYVYNDEETSRPCVSVRFILSYSESPLFYLLLDNLKKKFKFFVGVKPEVEKTDLINTETYKSDNMVAEFNHISDFDNTPKMTIFKVEFFFDNGFTDEDLKEIHQLFEFFNPSYDMEESFDGEYFDRLEEIINA